MIIKPVYIVENLMQIETFISIRRRKLTNGIETVAVSITRKTLDALLEQEKHRPGSFNRGFCEIYPDDPKPAPLDILKIEINHDPKIRGKILLVVEIYRKHYEDHPRYKIKDIKNKD